MQALQKGKKIERYLDVKPAVEEYTKFTYIGKSLKRTDYRMKVMVRQNMPVTTNCLE
jgi:hypothetical protein